MSYDAEMDHRRSIRLHGYDYSRNGAYFVTLCTDNKRPVFGEIIEENVALNAAGSAAKECWLQIPNHFPCVVLDAFVIMPTHVHGIVFLDSGNGGGDDWHTLEHCRDEFHGTSRTIGSIIRGFKIGVTKWFRDHDSRVVSVWQRNYYERIIRDEAELNKFRKYIMDNAIGRGE